jgi:hypothetical protein
VFGEFVRLDVVVVVIDEASVAATTSEEIVPFVLFAIPLVLFVVDAALGLAREAVVVTN